MGFAVEFTVATVTDVRRLQPVAAVGVVPVPGSFVRAVGRLTMSPTARATAGVPTFVKLKV